MEDLPVGDVELVVLGELLNFTDYKELVLCVTNGFFLFVLQVNSAEPRVVEGLVLAFEVL